MENEKDLLTNESGTEQANDVAAYIETIKEMRENYRPKEELEAKDKQISQLLDALRQRTNNR